MVEQVYLKLMMGHQMISKIMDWLKQEYKKNIEHFAERAKQSETAEYILRELLKQYKELFCK